jgi:hypothetical protein
LVFVDREEWQSLALAFDAEGRRQLSNRQRCYTATVRSNAVRNRKVSRKLDTSWICGRMTASAANNGLWIILLVIAITILVGEPCHILAQQANVPQPRGDLMVTDVSKADNSVDPALITYIGSHPNMYGQPMHVMIPARFATEAGLIATARRLAKDNAKYPPVLAPVQIYSDGNPALELAEYWHNKRVHDLRLNDSNAVLRKIVKFAVH